MTSSIKWWCYLHHQGQILTKRFMVEGDGRDSIFNAKEEMKEGNNFVLAVLDHPIEAPDQKTAAELCGKALIEQLAAQGIEVRMKPDISEVFLWKDPDFKRGYHRFDNLELE